MKEAIENNDSLAEWLVRMFGGSSCGTRIYWDNRNPQSGRPGEHLPPYFGYPPVIRIPDANDPSGVDKCVILVFEFHNLQRHESFQEAARRAMKKDIDREQYAMRCVELEFAAIRDTQKFLTTYCLVPPTTKRRDKIYEAFLAPPMSFDDWVRSLDARGDGEYDPREYFRQAYDQRIKPYVGVGHKKRTDDALREKVKTISSSIAPNQYQTISPRTQPLLSVQRGALATKTLGARHV